MEKNKPGRNWRVLLTEIGIIVLGVGIALAAQQSVDWWQWRSQVRDAKEAIASETAQNVGTALVMWRGRICTERRLDELSAILDKAAETGRLPPVGDIGRPPRRGWRTGAWDTVVASQTASHFPRQELVDLASIYTWVRQAQGVGDFIAWTKLYPMVGPGRRLDPASEADLRNALSEARALTRAMANIGSLIIDRVQRQNLPFNQQDLALIATLKREAQNSEDGNRSAPPPDVLRGGFTICRPIGAVPAHYGQGHTDGAPDLTDERLKALDFGAR